MNIFTRDLKEKIVLSSWVLGILIFISLFWILTSNVQTRYMLRTINDVFISREDPRRISSSQAVKSKNLNIMGFRYNIYNTTETLFVFTVFQDGILLPLGAVVTNEGFVNEIIPLSAHSKTVYEKIPESLMQMYIKRIEMAGEK